VKHSSLLGLVPLVLYLGAFTLVPVVSTLVLSFRTPAGHWGLVLVNELERDLLKAQSAITQSDMDVV
jgi:ABC-type sugar transport system permease subunit